MLSPNLSFKSWAFISSSGPHSFLKSCLSSVLLSSRLPLDQLDESDHTSSYVSEAHERIISSPCLSGNAIMHLWRPTLCIHVGLILTDYYKRDHCTFFTSRQPKPSSPDNLRRIIFQHSSHQKLYKLNQLTLISCPEIYNLKFWPPFFSGHLYYITKSAQTLSSCGFRSSKPPLNFPSFPCFFLHVSSSLYSILTWPLSQPLCASQQGFPCFLDTLFLCLFLS